MGVLSSSCSAASSVSAGGGDHGEAASVHGESAGWRTMVLGGAGGGARAGVVRLALVGVVPPTGLGARGEAALVGRGSTTGWRCGAVR